MADLKISSSCSSLRILAICATMLAASNPPANAADDPQCTARFNTALARIERDAAATAPKASDQLAAQRWSRKLHDALEAAGREAEACNKRSKPPLSQQERADIEACLAKAVERLDTGEKQYKGRTLTMAEQTAQRALHQQVVDERAACMKMRQR